MPEQQLRIRPVTEYATEQLLAISPDHFFLTENPFPLNIQATLHLRIIKNLSTLILHRIRNVWAPYSVDKQRTLAILEMRHQILMSLLYPMVAAMATNKTKQDDIDVIDEFVGLIEAAIASPFDSEPVVKQTLAPKRGTIYLSDIHDFPILLEEAARICASIGLDFPSLSNQEIRASDIIHEMEHLQPIIQSEGALPIVGIEFFFFKKPGSHLFNHRFSYGYKPFATYHGSLALREFISFLIGDESDMSEIDGYAKAKLDHILMKLEEMS